MWKCILQLIRCPLRIILNCRSFSLQPYRKQTNCTHFRGGKPLYDYFELVSVARIWATKTTMESEANACVWNFSLNFSPQIGCYPNFVRRFTKLIDVLSLFTMFVPSVVFIYSVICFMWWFWIKICFQLKRKYFFFRDIFYARYAIGNETQSMKRTHIETVCNMADLEISTNRILENTQKWTNMAFNLILFCLIFNVNLPFVLLHSWDCSAFVPNVERFCILWKTLGYGLCLDHPLDWDILSMYCLEAYPMNDKKMKNSGNINWTKNFESLKLYGWNHNKMGSRPHRIYVISVSENETHRTIIPKSHQSIVRAYRFKRYKHWAHNIYVCDYSDNIFCFHL